MKDTALFTFGMKKREILLSMSLQYLEVIYWEHQVALDKEMHTLDKKVRNVFKSKVEADMLSLLQLNKYDLGMGLRRFDRKRNENSLKLAKIKLAAFWGVKKVSFSTINSCFYRFNKIKSYALLEKKIKKHPSLVYFKALRKMRTYELAVASSLSIPNITVNAGVRYYQDNYDVGGVLGLSIPIPLSDNNKGELLEVNTRIAKDKSEELKIKLTLKTSLKEHYTRLKNLEFHANSFVKSFLPIAKKTFKKIEEGYRLGKLSYIEVLDAKSIVNKVHYKIHRVLLDYMRSYFIISYLTGEQPAILKKGVFKHCL
jgi:outer membrane protein, heavy metal efflux system